MYTTPFLVAIIISLINGIFSKSVELTFELPDSAMECFYQDIEQNTSASLEYQVHFGFRLTLLFIYGLFLTALPVGFAKPVVYRKYR